MTNENKKRAFTLWPLVAAAVLVGVAVGAVVGLSPELPQIRSLETYRPAALTRVLAIDRSVLAEIYGERRDPVPLSQIPRHLTEAVIAIEDQSFFEHRGVDIKAIVRAAVRNVSAGKYVEGASTITQQLAKTLFLTPEKTLKRKVHEALLALQLERRYTKQEILQLYLNQIYFGSGAYGVASAARIFFGKTLDQLTLAECALIAAMPRAPSRYSPLNHPELAVERRNIVLRTMRNTGMISEARYKSARDEPLKLAETSAQGAKLAPHFVQFVQQQLEASLGSSQLYRSGLTIFTTLKPDFQVAAEDALLAGLEAVDKRTGRVGVQGALICLDPASGAIWALVGGRNFEQSAFDRATMALRQPGSAFKPIVYACAIHSGHNQNEIILDAPVVYSGGTSGAQWRPQNFSPRFSGAVTLREALARSINIPAVKLLDQLGPGKVIAFARELGITTELDPNLSLALGSSAVTLMDLTGAYGAFINQGKRSEPFGIIKVVDDQGRTVFANQPRRSVVMLPATAAVVADMLRAVVTEGTARQAREIGFAVAGKTGTSNDFKDALFIGFSPRALAGVWVGRDDAQSIGRGETGGRAALPIWMSFMAVIHGDRQVGDFVRPDSVVVLPIDPKSGQLADPKNRSARMMLFKADELPPNLR
jgi:penicillin-binding protein 1A